MSLTPPNSDESSSGDPHPNQSGSPSLPREIVQPVLRYMEVNGIGRMSLNVEALDPPPGTRHHPPRTITGTALLERESWFESDDVPQLGLTGVFITVGAHS